jgi:DNA mismatch endonuclease (patch repair protein)
LHRRGLRFRVDRSPDRRVRCRADLVFGPSKIAVFVDGCFWHGCPEHASWPKVNADWWSSKIDVNRRRDRETARSLTEAGWLVIRVWEHDDPLDAADAIQSAITARLAAKVRRGNPSMSEER